VGITFDYLNRRLFYTWQKTCFPSKTIKNYKIVKLCSFFIQRLVIKKAEYYEIYY